MLKHPGKRIKTVILSVSIIACFSFFDSKFLKEDSSLKNYIGDQAQQLILTLDQSLKIADSVITPVRAETLKLNYFKARTYYKHIECFIECCSPFDVKYFINGPLVKKSDLEIGKRIVDPHGFQVIEEQLFGTDTVDQQLLMTELKLLKDAFNGFKSRLADINISESQVLEMMQFELIRMGSLSLSGADATYTKTNVTECRSVFKGFENLLKIIKEKSPVKEYPLQIHDNLMLKIKQAEAYCNTHLNYDSFDRLFFITRHIKPVYKSLVKLHRSELFPFTSVNYAIDLHNENAFERQSYNLNYFSVKAVDTVGNTLQAKLGEFLFFDPVLSGNNQRACASCHKPDMAFSDGLEKATEFLNKHQLERNTPSLLNTIFQKHFFYDGRARQLEQQANDVLHNEKEMHSSIEEMISKLNQSHEYRNLFYNAYKGTIDTVISYYGILKAISEYEKTLVSMNSRFDRYIKGNYKQLSVQEIKGYNLFSGKALCGSCHFFPLFNSLVPPIYNDTEYEVIGVPEKANGKTIDPDEGRILVSKVYIHQYAFKTPTVRNSSLTAPYMHNGIYKTLDEVIDFYNKGGGQGIGINLPHQTLPFDSLQLNKKEIAAIKAFMFSLADTSGFNKKPVRLPKFNNLELNDRKIGGAY